MCETLGVSRSGYYEWLQITKSEQQQRKEFIMRQIERIFFENYEVYGSPRITKELQKNKIDVTERTVGRYMREMGLSALQKTKVVKTTNSNHDNPIYPNTVDRKFNPPAPDEVWSTDITYIWTSEGWMYLAVVMDLFSRKIIGWNMGEYLTKDLAITALNRAYIFRDPSDKLTHHSDRGSQYTSKEYIALLHDKEVNISMSRKGDCFDNACVEAFFATLKKELVYRKKFHTRDEAKMKIWKYIASFYNEKRIHSTIGYVSPNEYERAYLSSNNAQNKVTA